MVYFPTVAMRGFLLVFPCWQVLFTGAQDIPTTNCKEYIDEGETLSCYCLGDCSNGAEPTMTWPGHSNTDFLENHNISRQQHGQNFTCRKVCGKETTEVKYTLQVAYGPDAASTKITGPSPFITNGTLSMTLTCEGTVNPTPIYAWFGVSCDNRTDDRTCTYTPSITEDGKLVKCKLTNPKNSQTRPVTVEFAMSLSYPPLTAPNISEGSGSILTAKDILTCTVTGGKPQVDSVNFTCTSPYHAIQDREATSTSVSSSLTIDTSQATTNNMTCYCSANWAPRPDFYTMKSERNFLIESPPRPAPEYPDGNTPLNKTIAEVNGNPNKASTPHPAAIAGGVVGSVVCVSVAIVLVMIAWKRKYQRYEKPQPRREDEGSPYTELQPPPFANSEEGIVNYANTEPRPDLSQPEDPDSYVNVETTQNTYEQIQPRLESTDNNYSTLYTRK